MTSALAAAGVATILVMTGTACSSTTSGSTTSGSTTSGSTTSGSTTSDAGQPTTITVAAASSLTDVLGRIGADFMAANPGIEVRFSFAGSSAIAEQIREGAPLDVFASAGMTIMEPLVAESLVGTPTSFATNTLMIAVPPDNPGGVTRLADLSDVSVILCQPQVPCGTAADDMLETQAIDVSPVSLEPDVRSVLSKIEADEVDAGIVYVTDVRAAGGAVLGIEIPAEANVTTTYQAAAVTATAHAAAATAFVAYLQQPGAQAVLAQAGFGNVR